MKWQGAQIPVRETFITPLAMVAASQYLDKIDFTRMVNEHVQWDPAQCNLSPGMLAKSVVLSTFDKKRVPYIISQKPFLGWTYRDCLGWPVGRSISLMMLSPAHWINCMMLIPKLFIPK